MLPSDDQIIEDIIQLLADNDPGVDPLALRAKRHEPLDQIYPINSQIGVDIATQLAEKYDLPAVLRMKLRQRKDYISIGGLLDHIKKRCKGD